MSQKLLPGQKPTETQEEYLERINKRVEERLKYECNVPERFSNLSSKNSLKIESPIYRTCNNDYGSIDMTEYERPSSYHVIQHTFTEHQHLGQNYEHPGMNM